PHAFEIGPPADPFHSLIEIRPHEDRDVEQLLSRETEVLQVLFKIRDLRRYGSGATLAREEFSRADGKESDHSRRPEQEGVVILRTRSPHVAALREECGLRLPFARGLNPRDAQRS